MKNIKDALLKTIKNPIIWITAIYLLFPADFISDAIPVVGTADDLIALVLVTFIVNIFGGKDMPMGQA